MNSTVFSSVLKEIRNYSDTEWEIFVSEWAKGLAKKYHDVKKFGAAGDMGRDVVGFESAQKFDGKWDNYQCKHLEKPISAPIAGVEIAKIIYFTSEQKFSVPRQMYFLAPRDVSTDLADLLGSPSKLRSYVQSHWNSGYSKHIANKPVLLEGQLADWETKFDYSIFSWKPISELIEDYRQTAYWFTRFGGILPPPLKPDVPADIQPAENTYVAELLAVYEEQEKCTIPDCAALTAYPNWHSDLDKQRERFYCAEAFHRTYRDETPPGTVEQLALDIHDSIDPILKQNHPTGFDRLNGCLAQAAAVTAGGILAQHARPNIKQGVCHHLANDSKVSWIKK